jgi:hypothetical protein
MGLTGNFDSPMQLAGGRLTVSGSSEPLDDGELVARHVVVVQDGVDPVEGAANLNLQKWEAGPLSAPGFEEGDALALGCETFLVNNGAAIPSFSTFTWSQNVKIEEA